MTQRCVRIRKQAFDFEHLPGYSSCMSRDATILIVDDDEDVLTAARLLLRKHVGRVLTRCDPGEIPEIMEREAIDLFLLDMNFAIGRNSGDEGLHWLREIRRRDANAVVVLMTAYGDLNTAVRAMREGAADFVLKPWQNDKLLATIAVAVELRRTRARVSALSEPPPERGMIATAPAMARVMKVVERVAATDATVLIRGENGTGKELIARELHRLSPRAQRALVSVDLGAVSETLFDSELFGHRRGAFTGADRDRAGRFQAAHGATLFLDEIGNLTPALQAKLLRALETGEITPLGVDQAISVDVRLIAATNRPLEEMVAQGSFREDLLYRINTVTVELPPLRERLEDLPALVERFASEASRRYGLAPRSFSRGALAAMADWSWPGNIRELSHTVERAVILGEEELIEAEDLDLQARHGAGAADSLDLEENERRLVETALARHEGNVSRAASALGITRAALYRRMEKFRL